jgi:hypothetical protein
MSAAVRAAAATLAARYARAHRLPADAVTVVYLDDEHGDRAAVYVAGYPPWTTSGPSPRWLWVPAP